MRRLALLLIILLAACSPGDLPYKFDDLPQGDAARGQELFTQSIDGAPSCSSCHSVAGRSGVGPTLEGYGAEAGTRVGGQSGAEYTFFSIVRPAKHLVTGYSNVMYSKYGDKLGKQDTADLIAYLMSL